MYLATASDAVAYEWAIDVVADAVPAREPLSFDHLVLNAVADYDDVDGSWPDGIDI